LHSNLRWFAARVEKPHVATNRLVIKQKHLNKPFFFN